MRPKIDWQALKQPHVLISASVGAIAAASYTHYAGVLAWAGFIPALVLGILGFVVGMVAAPDVSDPRIRRIVATSIALYLVQAVIVIGARWGQPNDAGLFPLLWMAVVGVFVADVYARDPKVTRNGALIGAGIGLLLGLCITMAPNGSIGDMGGWAWLPLPLLIVLSVLDMLYTTATFGVLMASHFISFMARPTEEEPVSSVLIPPSEDLNFEYDGTTGVLADKGHDEHGSYIHLNGTLFRCSNTEYKAFQVGKRYTIYYDPGKIIVGARELVAVEI